MRHLTLLISAALTFNTALSQTSNLQTVKGWKRTHIIGVTGGTLLDPTGSLADGQRLAATLETVNASSNLVRAADIGLSNALFRLNSVAVRTNEFSGRIYIAADMDDDPDYANAWGAVGQESVETNGTLHYYCHYNRELAKAPRTRWSFDIAPDTVLCSDGVAQEDNAMTNVAGVACYDIAVAPPANVGNVLLRANKFMRNGAPGYPLDVDDAGITIIKAGETNDAFTGSVVYTNAPNVITETYLSGTLYLISTNSIGGIQ